MVSLASPTSESRTLNHSWIIYACFSIKLQVSQPPNIVTMILFETLVNPMPYYARDPPPTAGFRGIACSNTLENSGGFPSPLGAKPSP
jgi:hypothetical protein